MRPSGHCSAVMELGARAYRLQDMVLVSASRMPRLSFVVEAMAGFAGWCGQRAQAGNAAAQL